MSSSTEPSPAPVSFFGDPTYWQERLEVVVDMMREMSTHSDPQEMVRAYAVRMQQITPTSVRISLSRRGLAAPEYRITRYSGWTEEVNPWKEADRLPLLSGGVIADLIYADRPQIIDDLVLADDDPAREYLGNCRSLLAIPLYESGVALNMVLLGRDEPSAFSSADLPERVWMANLFGRATQNLVLAERLREAYHEVDRELQVVADIQRSLLPHRLPQIPGLQLAASYQTSRKAGGDYYDFFALPENRWGLLIADVSGHGTPAAVMMAVTHCIAHMYPGDSMPPHRLLAFLNHHLSTRYTPDSGHFVTAFYGIYDPDSRRLHYTSAGHNPPRLKRCGQPVALPLDQATSLPLGISEDVVYRSADLQLEAGDRLVFYTDGITEAVSPSGELFQTERLDQIVSRCHLKTNETLERILAEIDDFTCGGSATDDRTLVVMDVE